MEKKQDLTGDFENSKFAKTNGQINENRLFSYIYNKKSKDGTNSVLTPSAHTITVCKLCDSDADRLEHVREVYKKLTRKNHVLGKVIELQLFYGLRISEVLNIHSSDINSLGQICIRGLKGSNDRIITPITNLEFYIKMRKLKIKVFQHISRFYVYREYKKMGISAQFNGNSKNSVTHMLRHLVIKNNKIEGYEMETIKQFIGHKSIKSTEHYGK